MATIKKEILEHLLEQFNKPRAEFDGKSYASRRRDWFEQMAKIRPMIATPEAIDRLTENDVSQLYKKR